MSESGSNPTLQPVVSNSSTNVWCRSVCESVKINCEWIIENFIFQGSSGFPLECKTISAEMSAEEFPDLKWSFELIHFESSVYVYMLIKNNAKRDIPFKIKSAFVNKKQQKVNAKEQYFMSKAGINGKFDAIYPQTISRIHSDSLLSDEGHLAISCEMEALSAIKNSSGITRSDQAQLQSCNQLNSLIENIGKFFINDTLTDVTLSAGGKEFQAHEAILAASSPVFRSMFEQNLKVKFSSQVDVQDVEPDVLLEVLRFIYTGRISATKMEELSYELLAAADKYLLENLKSECENHLKSQISNENCIEILLLADRHSVDNLKQNAVDFFRGKMAQVMESDAWKNTKKYELVRLFEILKTVLD